MSDVAITPARRVDGELAVPGDKSISHRALLVAGIGHGSAPIRGLSPADDVRSTARALRRLGVEIEVLPDASSHDGPGSNLQVEPDGSLRPPRDFHILVEGRGWEALKDPEGPIDVGNSGTTIRLLTGIVAASAARATLSGDSSILRRPMKRVVAPLRAMGADITGPRDGGFAPLTIRGRPLEGLHHTLDVASAQVKSALLLAGLRASGVTSILEPTQSRDHSERLFRYLQIPIDVSTNGLSVSATDHTNAEISVPGDLSSAAFFLAAAAILPGSSVRVVDVGVNPTRAGILEILRAYGASVEVTDERERCGEPVATVTVRASDRRPIEVAGDLVVRSIDELPLVAVLGALAEGGATVVRDAEELRVKESDRIATMTTALRAMGADIEPTPDGFVVHPSRLQGGATVDPFGDHRIAMASAVAALGAKEAVTVRGWECVGVSYPGFEEDLGRLVVR